ncbi:hypothetical protein [Microvirga alba]|uniref:Uncharacterized protein n=1 Tax=Microvirga alba TaxID=2791025 RepID=A0A931FPW9_9HYPH|nr:hypothetical protein [Microvirga alba]MBF9235384.1 hypothetical protein [Microvirga alba]
MRIGVAASPKRNQKSVAEEMSKSKIIITVAVLFAMIVIKLGALGYLLIEDPRILVMFIAAVIAFAAWVSRETYRSQVVGISADKRR